MAVRAHAPLKWRILTPFIVLLSLPFMSYAALKFGEAGMDVLKSLPPLVIALAPGQQRSLDKTKAMRVHLSNAVANLIDDLGPKVFENFDETRIVVPSAAAPPSSSSGLWRRTSSTGAVDAQGLGLIHPMTWLDERLFGWSRSAKRGTSAWLGGSEYPSRAATPSLSDDEESGDYDHVIRLLPPHEEQSNTGKARSRQSSYADLQRLRMGPLSQIQTSQMPPLDMSSADDSSPTQLYQRIRSRRPSLSSGIAVSRIAAEDPNKTFPEATQILNQEKTK